MKFKEALELMKLGLKVKRSHWSGYWQLEYGKVMMYCKNGEVLDLRQTDDTLFTLSNIVADDWEAVGEANSKLLQGELIHTFTFGEAVRLLKQGKKVCRKGWNGKGQFIELATNVSYITPKGDICNVNHEQMGNKAIAFIGTSGVQLGWLASQADMLSEDWMIFGDAIEKAEEPTKEKDKLKELAQPLCNYLYEHGCPHDRIIITQTHVEHLSGVKASEFELKD